MQETVERMEEQVKHKLWTFNICVVDEIKTQRTKTFDPEIITKSNSNNIFSWFKEKEIRRTFALPYSPASIRKLRKRGK